MHKIPGPEIRVMATKAAAIRAVMVVMVIYIGRPIVVPMPWMPMSSRGIQLISLKGINKGHLVIMSSELMKLSQKTEFRNFSLQSIA